MPLRALCCKEQKKQKRVYILSVKNDPIRIEVLFCAFPRAAPQAFFVVSPLTLTFSRIPGFVNTVFCAFFKLLWASLAQLASDLLGSQ